ncbi:MAG: glycosyltransferase family 39 protein [Planctomycetes bacterium]|nr:glycosyltransferase family 39 protein [Planctomycetota bacterium]
MLDGTSLPATEHKRFWRSMLALLIVSVTVLRFIYLGWCSSLDLAPDEAHYWDWSRNLDWSYYSKGPLVAWIIRLGVELFGPLSLALTGAETMAVRLPAVFCGGMLMLALYVLTVQTLRSERTAFFMVLFVSLCPIFNSVSMLITIDSPFVCLWTWALVAGHRAIFRGERWAWCLTGLLVGLGILAKYTTALWLFSFGLFLLFTPAYRPLLFQSRFWLMTSIAFASCLPILWWNATHDWVTFRHVAGQAGVPTAGRNVGIRWLGPLEYIGGQFAILIGYWFVAWACAMFTFRPTRETDPSKNYLWWMSLPTFTVFLISSFKAGGQVNWPVAAYLSGSVLMTAWILQAVDSASISYRRLARVGLSMACTLCLLLTVAMHETRNVRPLLREVAVRLQADDPYSLRRVDPTCRLRGWSTLGQEIDIVRQQIEREEGRDPILAGPGWNMPGEIGFYCKGHPQVFCFGAFFGGRHSQYDIWRPNPVADQNLYIGRTFVVVNGSEASLRSFFGDVVLAKDFIYREGNVPIANWTIWICRNYRGLETSNVSPRENY